MKIGEVKTIFAFRAALSFRAFIRFR